MDFTLDNLLFNSSGKIKYFLKSRYLFKILYLSRYTSCCQSWVKDWVLQSGLRNYNGSSQSF